MSTLMSSSGCVKKNLEETDAHMLAWLEGRGMVVGHWGTGFPSELDEELPADTDLAAYYTDIPTIVAREDANLRRKTYPLDILPIAIPDLNTLPFALYLGAKPTFTRRNIWYSHTDISPENDRSLELQTDNPLFLHHLELLKACRDHSRGDYLVGFPALVPNLDVLAELRGVENLMVDMLTDPDWVLAKLAELNRTFLTAYPRMLPLVTDEKGWSTYGFFMFRGPGKVGLVHCDTAALISEEMFRTFVVPFAREQCRALDWSLYHVDGPSALRTVDPLLEIEELTALQYTPGPQVPQGGDPRWYDLYRKIKAAGKRVMAVWIEPEEIQPLLDAVGPEGMYLMVNLVEERQIEQTDRLIEPYR
jgi:hypothetical protein